MADAVEPLFCIEERDHVGKALVAKFDLRPGIELFIEEPLLCISSEYNNLFGDTPQGNIVALYSSFRSLSKTNQHIFLQLFGPISGIQGAEFRRLAEMIQIMEPEQRCLNVEEKEEFARIASIYTFNCFCDHDNNRQIFSYISRANHSCEPNCYIESIGDSIKVFKVILPVMQGEELTISYDDEYNIRPVHSRRHRYLETKQFTCHCPRCIASGDDTRQFSCIDLDCLGQHLACQPVNEEETIFSDLHYTDDIKYVEPYLLPCTVCGTVPPIEYQQKMFQMESCLPALSKQVRDECDELIRTAKDAKSISRICRDSALLFDKIDAINLPPKHMLSRDLLKIQITASTIITKYDTDICRKLAYKDLRSNVCLLYAQNHDTLFYPNTTNATAFHFVSEELTKFNPSDEEIDLARECARKALRITLLLRGRDRRNALIDETLCAALKVGKTESIKENSCAFCHVTPVEAAIVLSLCLKCKQVSYCSNSCQTAHWKFHQTSCDRVGVL